MAENIRRNPACLFGETLSAASSGSASRRPRTGIAGPSQRATGGILQWIDEAHAAQRVWSRNALALVAILVGLLLLAFGV